MEQKIVAKKGVGIDELHLYLTMLKDHKLITNTTPHAEMARLVYTNFGAIVSKKSLQNYFNPTVDEEELDLVLAYRNLGYEM